MVAASKRCLQTDGTWPLDVPVCPRNGRRRGGQQKHPEPTGRGSAVLRQASNSRPPSLLLSHVSFRNPVTPETLSKRLLPVGSEVTKVADQACSSRVATDILLPRPPADGAPSRRGGAAPCSLAWAVGRRAQSLRSSRESEAAPRLSRPGTPCPISGRRPRSVPSGADRKPRQGPGTYVRMSVNTESSRSRNPRHRLCA